MHGTRIVSIANHQPFSGHELLDQQIWKNECNARKDQTKIQACFRTAEFTHLTEITASLRHDTPPCLTRGYGYLGSSLTCSITFTDDEPCLHGLQPRPQSGVNTAPQEVRRRERSACQSQVAQGTTGGLKQAWSRPLGQTKIFPPLHHLGNRFVCSRSPRCSSGEQFRKWALPASVNHSCRHAKSTAYASKAYRSPVTASVRG